MGLYVLYSSLKSSVIDQNLLSIYSVYHVLTLSDLESATADMIRSGSNRYISL